MSHQNVVGNQDYNIIVPGEKCHEKHQNTKSHQKQYW
jgi:hypothetical protein